MSIFAATPSSIRRCPAATTWSICRRQLAAGGATLVQLRDKLSDTRVMVERARAIKAALGARAASDQRPRRRGARLRRRRRSHRLGGHGAGGCAPPARPRCDHRADHQQPAARRRDRPRTDRLRRHRRRLWHDLEGHQEFADRACRHGARDRGAASAEAGIPHLRHRRHQRGQRRAGDRGGRRRRVGDLGAVACQGPARGGSRAAARGRSRAGQRGRG